MSTTTWTPTAAATRAIAAARAAVGSGSALTGWCERFTRGCFAFPAAYASAYAAFLASRAAGGIVPSTGEDAPAGAVFFWDITSGSNAAYDHVAPVVAPGIVASTSAGPGRTVALVRIVDLTRAWGMTPRGWAHVYHGQPILTAQAPPAPVPTSWVTAAGVTEATVLSRLRTMGLPASRAGARQWQEAHGLVPDGVWGLVSERYFQYVLAKQAYVNRWRRVQQAKATLRLDGWWGRLSRYAEGLARAGATRTVPYAPPAEPARRA